LLLSLAAIMGLSAQNAWTMELVPNTRIQSDYIHVSDPDGYLSSDVEQHINTALNAIRDDVDVFLVTLGSIGYEEPKDFANKLLNYWGVGDKGKDNGLMLLFVEDQHAFELETGYGIEPILTDVKCYEIFNKTIKPYFVEGDYEGGMYAGVLDIVKVFGGTVPADVITELPDETMYEEAREVRDKEIMSNFYVWFAVFFLAIPFISLVYYVYRLKDEKKNSIKQGCDFKDSYTIKEYDGQSFIYDPENEWNGSAWAGKGCARFFTFGLSAIVWYALVYVVVFGLMKGTDDLVIRNYIAVITIICYLSFVCVRQNRRIIKMAGKVAKDTINPRGVYEKAKNYRRTKFFNYIAPWIGLYYMTKYDSLIEKCPVLRCPTCGSDMTKNDDCGLPDMQVCEEQLEVRRFMSAHCGQGHSFVIAEKGKKGDEKNY